MKIALIGSAPSSVDKAPFGDTSWEIWGCSPGAYSRCPRVNVWFEIHRWQPPVLGRADQQVSWLSPEYCGWMAGLPLVYMFERVPQIPNSRALPTDELRERYGDYNFTSTVGWMFAVALERLRAEDGPNEIGLWGIDMAAEEEYGYQRSGCQWFVNLARTLGVVVHVPPESDLMRPPQLYGIHEHSHQSIKFAERRRELTNRLTGAQQRLSGAQQEVAFLQGAIDDLTYHERTWRDGPVHEANLRAILSPVARGPETDRKTIDEMSRESWTADARSLAERLETRAPGLQRAEQALEPGELVRLSDEATKRG